MNKLWLPRPWLWACYGFLLAHLRRSLLRAKTSAVPAKKDNPVEEAVDKLLAICWL
jgi:hypothetical protein